LLIIVILVHGGVDSPILSTQYGGDSENGARNTLHEMRQGNLI